MSVLERPVSAEVQERNALAMKLLEQLTPGGSEFFQDPERCFEWVKERLLFSGKLAARATRAEAVLRAYEDGM